MTNPETPAQRRQRRTERLLLLLWLGLEADLWQLAQRALQGHDNAFTLPVRLREALLKAHLAAAALGVRRAGVPDLTDTLFETLAPDIARRVTQDQARYGARFAEDVRLGRYKPDSRGLRWRASLYANRLVGTANEAWSAALAEQWTFALAASVAHAASAPVPVRMKAVVREPLVLWVLGDAREHCDSCLEESRAGWRSLRDLSRVPGDGTTECNVGCKCGLRLQDGATSFSLKDLKEAAAAVERPGGVRSLQDIRQMRRSVRRQN